MLIVMIATIYKALTIRHPSKYFKPSTSYEVGTTLIPI